MKKLFSIMSSFLLSAKADDLESKILNLEHFDDFDEDFDDFEDFELDSLEALYDDSFENFKKRGYSSSAANKAALGKVKVVKGTRAAKAVQARKGYKGALINNVSPAGIRGDVRAMLDIVIQRNSNNINEVLYVPIFGGIHRESNYQQITSRYGGSAKITNITTLPDGNLQLEYTSGLLIDTIDIRCNQVPYATFLEASKFDTFTVFNSRYSLANPAQLNQFSQIYSSVNKTLFGQAIENQLTVNQFKDPRQYQNGIVDVKAQMAFDKDTALVVGTIDAAVEFTLGLFVNSFASGTRRV